MVDRTALDVRLGQTWSPSQRLKNDALWAIASIALTATQPLSLELLRRFGRTIGLAAHALVRSARRTALANVRRVFADEGAAASRARVRRCFGTLGELLGESVALLHAREAPPPLAFTAEGRAVLAEARGAAAPQGSFGNARGVLFASAHLGPWERVAGSVVAAGFPFVTVARESYDPRFSCLYARIRSGMGVRVVWRGKRAAGFAMGRALRRGEVLGMPMDLWSRVQCRAVPFLGHLAPTPIGPARLALKTGAAVVVGSAAPAPARGPGGDPMVVTATRIPTEDLPVDDIGALALTVRINDELSRRILAIPHAWPWMHDRWASHPAL